jgi:uncharacterized protein YbaR (Trm112 family)
VLACPACHGDVVQSGSRLACQACEVDYPFDQGVPDFTSPRAWGDDHSTTARSAGRA